MAPFVVKDVVSFGTLLKIENALLSLLEVILILGCCKLRLY